MIERIKDPTCYWVFGKDAQTDRNGSPRPTVGMRVAFSKNAWSTFQNIVVPCSVHSLVGFKQICFIARNQRGVISHFVSHISWHFAHLMLLWCLWRQLSWWLIFQLFVPACFSRISFHNWVNRIGNMTQSTLADYKISAMRLAGGSFLVACCLGWIRVGSLDRQGKSADLIIKKGG